MTITATQFVGKPNLADKPLAFYLTLQKGQAVYGKYLGAELPTKSKNAKFEPVLQYKILVSGIEGSPTITEKIKDVKTDRTVRVGDLVQLHGGVLNKAFDGIEPGVAILVRMTGTKPSDKGTAMNMFDVIAG